ncbi:MAG TPA: bifunctional glutamate N-acetyltransferase/amino-acid acetyltransferase ArgJ [Acidimicrobiales bacterium]|nr:bifunctional glutamate N-acetyltransferase/amino-acid acetyltransferase ArgJ [Acidimicrobiales bacterium]
MSVTAPRGFVAAGGSVGIKAAGEPDAAVVATDDGRAAPVGAVFTSNLAVAAPVQISRMHLAATGGCAAAVVLTSGNANAATGAPGVQAARRLCEVVAAEVGSRTDEVLVCQTGLIGVPFPVAATAGVGAVAAGRATGAAAGSAAATAIMTTDTVRKEVTVDAGTFTVGGMAKGAAMLAPDMATMLAVLTTDAEVDSLTVQRVLARAVERSFNALTVDGCTSTNDTVMLLAGGVAGPVSEEGLQAAVTEACQVLAAQMAADAEGATKVARVTVAGARSDDEAHRAARKVAGSLLVKCSLNGADPYWGRVVSELGSAGVGFDPDRVSVAYGGIPVCVDGVAADHDAAAVAAHMAGRHVEIACQLGLGPGSSAVLTTDLGYGYIDENRTTS